MEPGEVLPPELWAELVEMFRNGTTPYDLEKWVKQHRGYKISRARIAKYMKDRNIRKGEALPNGPAQTRSHSIVVANEDDLIALLRQAIKDFQVTDIADATVELARFWRLVKSLKNTQARLELGAMLAQHEQSIHQRAEGPAPVA